MSKIRRVLIVGGTHGNELIGVYTNRRFEQSPDLIRRPSLEVLTLFGNPQAIAAGTRYIDKDLNRCFAAQITESSTNLTSEMQRVAAIRNEFGPSGRTPVDFIIDQHGTTSNAGLMLILDQLDAFTLKLAAYLSALHPEIKVYSSTNSGRKQDSLRSIAPYRIGIEVGPVAHGTLHAELFQKNQALIYATLDYLDQYNCDNVTVNQSALTLYQYIGKVDYPKDETGEVLAMIHPHLQFKDYQALHPGDPMLLTFDGETIAYQGDSTVYPVFINEAAYYEKGIAMCLTQKQQIHLDAPLR
jgi:succinylglutamate desuccinylase